MIGYGRCENCSGARVVGRHCAVHLNDNERKTYDERLHKNRVLNIQGTTIDASLLNDLMWLAAGERTHTRPRGAIVALLLNGTRVRGDLDLNIEVLRFASFEGARFEGDVKLQLEAECPVSFNRTEFNGELDLGGSNFHHMVFFNMAQFRKSASFASVLVDEYAFFNSPKFEGLASFARLHAGGLELTGTTFTNPVSFNQARFGDDLEILKRNRGCQSDMTAGGT
jgi:hypothetical protein